jgi:hypothetical protein
MQTKHARDRRGIAQGTRSLGKFARVWDCPMGLKLGLRKAGERARAGGVGCMASDVGRRKDTDGPN